MEIKQLWMVIQRWWWLVLLPAIVALVLTLPSLRSMISSVQGYNVTLEFTASQQPDSTSGQDFQNRSYIPWLASEYAVNNLATWMKSDSFASEISKRLDAQGTKIDTSAIRGAISSDSARSVMTLYLSWPDADQIKAIAQAAIDVLKQQSQTYWPQLGAQPVDITPLDSIIVTPVPAPLMTRFSPLLRVGIGLVAGLALAFLAEYLDPRLRNRQEVEALGLAVIGQIPR